MTFATLIGILIVFIIAAVVCGVVIHYVIRPLVPAPYTNPAVAVFVLLVLLCALGYGWPYLGAR